MNYHKLLHGYFINSVSNNPDNCAISLGEKKWSYKEIDIEARRWSSALLQSNKSIKRVGVFANKTYIAYAAVLTALYSGAAYVPLNRMFPVERTLSMIDAADLDAIIVDEPSFSQLSEIIAQLKKDIIILAPDNNNKQIGLHKTTYFNCSALAEILPIEELPIPSENSFAYILFTSGSTGIPKGVPITHSNAVSFIEYNLNKYKFTSEDRFTQTFDLTFDLSVFDLFMSWGSGACLCVMRPIELLAPFKFIEREKITVWFSVPSIISLYRKKQLLSKNCMPSLHWSLFCGEALTQSSVEAWEEAAPGSIIENLYGPTELTIACSSYRWMPESSPSECHNGIVPIGSIYEHLNHIVVEENLTPVKEGHTGELCVSGAQMFHGYLNNKEQTDERLVKIDSIFYYRTGDLVRWDHNYYTYLGRIDHQTKVQGYRIELGEIESVMRLNNHVVDAAAIAWPIENGEAQGISAFASGRNINKDDIIQLYKTHLPNYMQPKQLFIIEEMPYNTNGKINYNALKEKLNEVNSDE